MHHKIVIVGGGTAGISVAARLRRLGQEDVAVIEPASRHYYQPLWTLAGGGCAPVQESVRSEASVMPKGVAWIKDAAASVDPGARTVTTDGDTEVGYDYLVVCPGIQLDWGKVAGMPEAIGTPAVSSNYTYETAPKTWELIKGMRRGTALFTMGSGPIKGAGAPQKAAYLACDYWRQQDCLSDIHVVLVLPTPAMFGVKEFSDVLEQVIQRYGIDVRLASEMVEIDPGTRTATIIDHGHGDERSEVRYDMAHVTPPQSAPDWIKRSPLADPGSPFGYVQVDKNTHRHVRYPEVFSLGDAGSTPNAKTGTAIRKQAPVVASNLMAAMDKRELPASYDGYASCPFTTARNRILLAEFDYTMRPHPTIAFINTQRERYDMWLLHRYGLPFMYWNLMLKGLG